MCLLVALGGLSFVWLGCGKKGPPRPPQRPLPPVVKDLGHTIQGNIVELSWTLPGTAGGSAAEPAAIKVLRATQTSEEIGCESCPFRFVVAAEIPLHAKASDRSGLRILRYSEMIDPGFRYIYKVIIFDEYGIGGKNSNIVKFDH
jgi:hypothetical protein